MIVRTLNGTLGTEREVDAAGWTSRRLLLKSEGMGFSLHDTLIKAGAELPMCYRNHLEAVYCIEGEGEVETTADGVCHQLRPGTVYALDQHDEHILRARTQMRMVCVFNPPVTGQEVHDESGAYPAEEPELVAVS
jgi:L-ectoine synthase